jgi:hypothetical protein
LFSYKGEFDQWCFLSRSSQYQSHNLNVVVEIEFGVHSKQCATHAVAVDVMESFLCHFITFCVKSELKRRLSFHLGHVVLPLTVKRLAVHPAIVTQSSSGERVLVCPSFVLRKNDSPLVLRRQSPSFALWHTKLPNARQSISYLPGTSPRHEMCVVIGTLSP